jgi:hypothetical protein
VKPSEDESAVIPSIRREVERLIREGRLGLYRGREFTGDERPVGPYEMRITLESPGSWQAPLGGK